MPARYQITVCPGCSTAFRVSEAQLKAAAGQVRCGMCLTLFDGVEALSTKPPVNFAQQKEALEALDGMVSELLADDRVVAPRTAPSDTPSQAPVAESAADNEDPGVPMLEPAPLLPEALAEREIDSPPPAEPQRLDPEPVTREPSEPKPGQAEQGLMAAAFDAEHPEELSSSVAGLSDPASSDPSYVGETPSQPVSKEAVSKGLVPTNAQPTGASPVQVASTEAASKMRMFAEIRAAAAALARRIALRPPRGLWLGYVLVPLGLLLVASFAIWLQFDSLARSEFRPVLERICAGLGCELPERRAVDQIKIESLKFSPAPDQPGKLRVGFTMVNKAPFEQQFPTLELRWSTVVGSLVAEHILKPTDYLEGDAAALSDMPIDTPIQIEQIIPEPGSQAVDYTLELR